MNNDDICRHTFLDRTTINHISKTLQILTTIFLALLFLRFGPTSLISVGHRAGYPIKSVKKIKTHIRHIYNFLAFMAHFKFNNDESYYETLRQNKKFCRSSQIFLGGWTRLRILPLPVSPRTSWIETAFNHRYKFTALHIKLRRKDIYFFISF